MVSQKEKVEINGKVLEGEETFSLSPFHSSFYYGLSIYETCFVTQKKVAFYNEHLYRLKNAASFLGINFHNGFLDELKIRIQKIINLGEYEVSRLRIIIAPKDYLKNYQFDSLLILTPIEKHPDSIKLCTSTIRKPYPNPYPSYLKLSSNHYSLFSVSEARQNGFDEGVILAMNGLITEGSYCNIFWVNGNKIFTPSLESSILEGVTRAKILESAQILGYSIFEGEYYFEELVSASSIYISSSTRGLLRVTRFDDRIFKEQHLLEIQDIQDKYSELLNESLELWTK
jgi:4-amino-4-deoxychorismate lyase